MKNNILPKSKWSDRDTMEFSQKVYSLLNAGIPLIESLSIVADQYKGAKRDQILSIQGQIKAGLPIIEAFKISHFPYLFFSILGISETHGKIADAFSKLAVWFERKSNFREQMVQKMLYPGFLFIFIIILFFYFLLILIPSFKELLSDFNSELPLSTTLLLNFQTFIETYYVAILIGILTIFILILCTINLLSKRKRLATVILKIPLLGRFLKIRFTHFFTSQLGLLLESGMGIWEALIEIRKHSPYKQLTPYIYEIENHILSGKPLSSVKLSIPILHKEYYRLTALGEQLGTIGAQLLVCSRLMEEKVEMQFRFLLKWVEPVVLLFLGGMIAFVILSLFLPMIQLIQSI